MRKPLIKTSLLALTIAITLGGGATIGNVKAQDKSGVQLKPQTNWFITKINSKGEGSDPYCTLAREYDQGIVFTMGRNMAEEYSLAIDFQNDTLDLDKAYSLTLQPGPGQIRAYEMMPASKQAMVVRLGWDESFLKALSKSNSLKAEMDGKEYTFDLSGFERGSSDLNACMKTLKEPSGNAIATVDTLENAPNFSAQKVAAEAVTEQEETLETSQVAESVEEKAPSRFAQALKNVVTPSAKDPAPAKIENVSNFKTKAVPQAAEPVQAIEAQDPVIVKEEPKVIEPAAKVAKEIPSKVAVPPRPVSDTAQSIGSTNPSDMEAKIADLMTQVDILKEQNSFLEQQQQNQSVQSVPNSTAIDAANAELKRANETNARLEKEMAALKEEMSKAKDAEIQKMSEADAVKEQERLDKIQAFEARIAELEEENKKFFEDAKQARGAIDSAKVEIGTQAMQKTRELEAQLEGATSDNLRLKAELEELRVAQENELLNEAGNDFNLQKVTQRFNESQREIQRLGAQLEAQRLNHSQEIQKLEGMLFDPAVATDNQRERLVELENKLKAAEDRANSPEKEIQVKELNERLIIEKKRADEYELKLKDKLSEIETLKQESIAFSEAKNKLELAQTDSVKIKADLNIEKAKVIELSQKISEQDTKLSTLQSQLDAKLKAENPLEKELNEKTIALNKAQSDLEAEKEKATLIAAKLVEQDTKLSSLQTQLAANENRINPNDALLKQKEIELSQFKNEMSVERTKMQVMADKLVSQDTKIAQLQSSIAATNAIQRPEPAALASLKSSLESEQDKNQKIAAKLVEQDNLIRSLQAAVSQKTSGTEQASVTLEEKQKEVAALQSSLQIKEDFLKEIAAESAQKDQEIKALSNQLASRGSQSMTAEQDISQKNAEIANLKQSLAAREKELAEKGTDIASLERALSQKERRVAKAEAEIASNMGRLATPSDLPAPSESRIAAAVPAVASRVSEAVAQPVQALQAAVPQANPAPSIGQGDIQNVLQRAGISASNIRMEKQQGDIYQYRWNTPELSGVAQVANIGSVGNASQFANKYISEQRGRCAGDFASVPASQGNGYSTYELACVDTNSSMSSSVIFFEKKGSVGVIAHQTSADDMDIAMDARDKVASQIGNL